MQAPKREWYGPGKPAPMAVPADRLHLLACPHALRALDGLLGRFRKRLPRHVDLDQLHGAALRGLARAAILWNPARGVPFVAYARTRMLGAIRDELRELDWVPRHVREERPAGAEPLNVCTGALDKLAAAASDGRPVAAEMHTRPCGAPAPDTQDPALAVESRETLAWALARLPADQRDLLHQVYLADPPTPMVDVARAQGVSLSAVSFRVKLARDQARTLLLLRFGADHYRKRGV